MRHESVNSLLVSGSGISESANEQFFWLEEGANYAGSNPRNQIQLDPEVAPGFVCIFFLDRGSIRIRVAAGEEVTHRQKPIDNLIVHSGSRSVRLEYKSLTFEFFQEGGRYALLVRPWQIFG